MNHKVHVTKDVFCYEHPHYRNRSHYSTCLYILFYILYFLFYNKFLGTMNMPKPYKIMDKYSGELAEVDDIARWPKP